MKNIHTKMMRSGDDEARFFSTMGRYFASPAVRKECGGYPLNDGPAYRWLVAIGKRDLRAVGFLCFEHQKDKPMVLRNGYIDPDYRGQGIFRELLRQAMHYADHHHLDVVANMPEASVQHLVKHGFKAISSRGTWHKIERSSR